MAAYPETIADVVFTKSVFMDGKKLGGVQGIDIRYRLEDKGLTKVVIEMCIKRDSLEITPDKISFKSTSYKEESNEDNKNH